VVREADRQDLGRRSGATSTGAWLSGRLRLRPAEAGRMVKLAKALETRLPATAEALRTGSISLDHATVVFRAIDAMPNEVGPGLRAQVEQVLVDHAKVFHPRDLTRIGRSVLQQVDPDLADRILARQLARDEARAERERELWIYDDPCSISTWLRGKLDPVTAEMLQVALDPLARPMPTTAEGPDTRTASQRLGDAFRELLRRYLAAAASPSKGGEKPQLIITIDGDDLADGTGTATLLHSGTPVSATTAQQFGCDGKVSWYIPRPRNSNGSTGAAGGSTGVGSDANGAATGGSGPGTSDGGPGASDGGPGPVLTDPVRFFVGKQRRLLELRDQGCAFPAVTGRPPGAKVITWSPGSAADPPASTTACCSVVCITG
jgi:Domain of unknown function (DUF222)